MVDPWPSLRGDGGESVLLLTANLVVATLVSGRPRASGSQQKVVNGAHRCRCQQQVPHGLHSAPKPLPPAPPVSSVPPSSSSSSRVVAVALLLLLLLLLLLPELLCELPVVLLLKPLALSLLQCASSPVPAANGYVYYHCSCSLAQGSTPMPDGRCSLGWRAPNAPLKTGEHVQNSMRAKLKRTVRKCGASRPFLSDRA